MLILNTPITQTIAQQTIALLKTHKHLYIDSMGGSVSAGMAIAARVSNHTTVNYGRAGSIAALIFVSGQNRIMHHTALIYLHDAAIGFETTLSEDRQILEVSKARSALIDLWERFGIDPTVERWIEARDAIALGLADQIL